MKQKRQIVGQTQEYPNAYIWYDYAVLCPECDQWTEDYGEVTTKDSDGDEHYLCTPCGDKVFPPAPVEVA